jgi:DNA-binding cell septation regulator SpoVG
MNAADTLPSLDAKVRLFHDPSRPESNLLGFADLTIGGAFVVKGIRILMGQPKDDKPAAPFISFPAKRGAGDTQDKWYDIAHPVTSEAYQAVRESVLKAYERASRGRA